MAGTSLSNFSFAWVSDGLLKHTNEFSFTIPRIRYSIAFVFINLLKSAVVQDSGSKEFIFVLEVVLCELNSNVVKG